MMLAPYCSRCRHRHDPAAKCWAGSRRARIVAHVLATQGRVCWICGGPASTVDHVMPRSKGGDDSDGNLRPACHSCNSRRGNDDNPFEPEPVTMPAGVGLSDRWRQ